MSTIPSYRNSVTNSTSRALIKANDEFEKAKRKIQDQNVERYEDFAELQDSGNPIMYNNAKRNIISSQSFKSNNGLISSSLKAEEQAISSLQDVLIKFEADYINAENTSISKIDICNRALEKIQGIINLQQDGKYIFGGANVHEVPIAGDLRTVSNLDQDKNFLNNYTNAAPNKLNVTISRGHDIEIGVDASNSAFTSLIGVINKIKGDNQTASVSLAAYPEINTTRQLFEQLKTTNLIQQQEIKGADTENESIYKRGIDDLQSSEYVVTYDELFQDLFNLFRSEKALGIVRKLEDKGLDELMRMFN